MLITIKVPENTGRLFYSVVEDGYERESVPVTMGMIVDVNPEEPVLTKDHKRLIAELSECHA